MSSGTIPVIFSCSGVDFPTQAASIQCVFGNSRVVRLYLVSPPEPHSIGNPRTSNLRNSSHLVALTAAASFSGAFAWAKIFFKRSGFFLRKSLISLVPLDVLHFSQARQRFDIRLVPPLARGTMCSTCNGISVFPQ